MTIGEITKHYVKAFKNGPLSSETKRAYETLKQHGEALGVDLNKAFFHEILENYQKEPQKYDNILSEEEINQDILSQYHGYIQRIQEQQSLKPMVNKNIIANGERGISVEIL